MRFLVVYSWYFLFHFVLNLESYNLATFSKGIASDLQHLGGMC